MRVTSILKSEFRFPVFSRYLFSNKSARYMHCHCQHQLHPCFVCECVLFKWDINIKIRVPPLVCFSRYLFSNRSARYIHCQHQLYLDLLLLLLWLLLLVLFLLLLLLLLFLLFACDINIKICIPFTPFYSLVLCWPPPCQDYELPVPLTNQYHSVYSSHPHVLHFLQCYEFLEPIPEEDQSKNSVKRVLY